MTEINHHLRTISESLANTYQVPYYQRNYRWKRKQFEELLNDLQDEFLVQFRSDHGRDRVSQYKSYFLGTILTTSDSETARKIIIDGQQRLTSLTLFFIYAHQLRTKKPELKISDVSGLIRRESYGDTVLNFEVDDNRRRLINLLLDNTEGRDSYDFIAESDEGTKNVFARFNDIEDILDDEIKENSFAWFVDWIANKVILFEIVVPTEHDAHKVFVTMNDRGLNLSPSEMLKGFLLSKITNPQKHKEAHVLWQERIRLLKNIDNDEDSNFIRTWLRAKYAEGMRGKNKDEKMDFELIGESYHRWLHDNKERVGLITDDDYQNFVLDTFKKFSQIYLTLLKQSTDFDKEYEFVFYNSSKDITLQYMVILAAIRVDDSDKTTQEKIKLVSKFIDYLTSTRMLSGKKNTYDNLRDTFFALTNEIRDKDIDDIRNIFRGHIVKIDFSIDSVEPLTYYGTPNKVLLHILARMASFIEDGFEMNNSVGFPAYVDRKQSTRTYDIEHLLCVQPSVFKESTPEEYQDFESDTQYWMLRSEISALILLPRSKNRSLQDKPYSEKRLKYLGDNVLAQTLCNEIYEHNPQAQAFIASSGLPFKGYDIFNKKSLFERRELYKKIIAKVWDGEAF
ncbi:DUF262 domain-containing protein [Pantoea sp. AMG 501]|uniref:DUF262 domain-containing protein n=1 Tax=Pantoea sp. AMG 501 TaxID=2008894 RepID=UPI000B5A4705|nr:DUF262 domain-containing protein [Pantoea sp. AMG 501]OWY76892.1 hypothetical protein CDN97_08140 [Pantoea sp. AMG 501]